MEFDEDLRKLLKVVKESEIQVRSLINVYRSMYPNNFENQGWDERYLNSVFGEIEREIYLLFDHPFEVPLIDLH